MHRMVSLGTNEEWFGYAMGSRDDSLTRSANPDPRDSMARRILVTLLLTASQVGAQVNEAALVDSVHTNIYHPNVTALEMQTGQRIIATLDSARGVSIASRVEAHAMIEEYLRAAVDDEDGITLHATTIMGLAGQLDSASRVRLASQLIHAYRDRAEVIAGHGDTPAALDLLTHAPAALPGVPGVAEGLADEVARYRMIGQTPPSITATHWLNAADGTTLDLSRGGPVTIIAFSAWWCPACSLSYPELLAAQQKYGADKVRLVLVTNLMGQFRSDTGLTTDAELGKLKQYFTGEHGLSCPIAVGDFAKESDEGDYGPIAKAYHVFFIPETLIIDRQGRVRRILVGWDKGNGTRVDEAVRLALAPAVRGRREAATAR
jgi:thiol-disulfide isomerase/thioredoxin